MSPRTGSICARAFMKPASGKTTTTNPVEDALVLRPAENMLESAS